MHAVLPPLTAAPDSYLADGLQLFIWISTTLIHLSVAGVVWGLEAGPRAVSTIDNSTAIAEAEAAAVPDAAAGSGGICA
jgi:hypothetical protein